jgi:hypothetical protein
MRAKRTINTRRIISALNFTNLTDEQSERIYQTLFEDLKFDFKFSEKAKPSLKVIKGGRK